MNKEYLDIAYFKCFEKKKVEINNLTVLVGVNGAGKSSVIQSLLLLRSSLNKRNGEELELDGIFNMDLGTSGSIINQTSGDNVISLSISNEDNGLLSFSYIAASEEQCLSLSISDRLESRISAISLAQNEFYYLNAERCGPRITQQLAYMKYPNVGIKGECTAQVLAQDGGRTKISQERMFPDSENPNLEAQTNAWLSAIMPGVRVVPRMDISTLSAQILIANIYTYINPALATNSGFGISYVLPVIVGALTAAKDSILIVENPEAHLHPAAQSAIGMFLARMAHSGLRIIIETHSDHVISGIQRFVAANPEWHDSVIINHFSLDENSQNPKVVPIHFDEFANYMEWPEGFMDQNQKDFIELCRTRNK